MLTRINYVLNDSDDSGGNRDQANTKRKKSIYDFEEKKEKPKGFQGVYCE